MKRGKKRAAAGSDGEHPSVDTPNLVVVAADIDCKRPYETFSRLPAEATISWAFFGMGRCNLLKERIMNADRIALAAKHGWDPFIVALSIWGDDCLSGNFDGKHYLFDVYMREWNSAIGRRSHRRQVPVAVMGTKSNRRTLEAHHVPMMKDFDNLRGKTMHFVVGQRIASGRVDVEMEPSYTCRYCGGDADAEGEPLQNANCGCSGVDTFLPADRFQNGGKYQGAGIRADGAAAAAHQDIIIDMEDPFADEDGAAESAIGEEVVGFGVDKDVYTLTIGATIVVGDMFYLNDVGKKYDVYSNAPREAANAYVSYAAVEGLAVPPSYLRHCRRAAANVKEVAQAERVAVAAGNGADQDDGDGRGGGRAPPLPEDTVTVSLSECTAAALRIHNGALPTPFDIGGEPFRSPMVAFDAAEFNEEKPSKDNKFGKTSENVLSGSNHGPPQVVWESAHTDHSTNQACWLQHMLRIAEAKGPRAVKLFTTFSAKHGVVTRINSRPGATQDEMKQKFHYQREFYDAWLSYGGLGPPEFAEHYSDDERLCSWCTWRQTPPSRLGCSQNPLNYIGFQKTP